MGAHTRFPALKRKYVKACNPPVKKSSDDEADDNDSDVEGKSSRSTVSYIWEIS